jgi:hypothetical protein
VPIARSIAIIALNDPVLDNGFLDIIGLNDGVVLSFVKVENGLMFLGAISFRVAFGAVLIVQRCYNLY